MKAKITISILLFVFPFIIFSQNALHFDGTNDRVNCGNTNATQITGNQITVEAWIKPTAFGTEYWRNNIVNKETWTPEAGYMLRCGAGGKLNFTLGNGTWHELVSSSSVLSLNVWQHVAGTYDGSYMRIYKNGNIVDSMAASFGNISNANAALTIGDYAGGGRYYNGAIDEVRIWNVVRTKQQLQAAMNSELCAGQPGLKVYYRFNQGVAGGNNSLVTTLLDQTSNASNGTLTNFALSGTTSNWVLGAILSSAPGGSQDTIYDVFCQGNTYSFGGQSLTAPGTYTHTFYTALGCDSIITLILSMNPSTSSTFGHTICQGSSYVFGSQNLTTPGTYYHTFTSANGCDSLVTLNLQVTAVDTSVTLVFPISLKANATNATYQWVDCDNGFSLISGANNSIFTPTTDGNYAVIVNQNGCTDTSECHNVTGTSINKTTNNNPWIVFPNPFSDVLTIQGAFSELEYVIYNSVGQIVGESKVLGNSVVLDLKDLKVGVYFMKIKIGGEVSYQKIVKVKML